MRIDQVIKAGFPEADTATCEHILWEMTPYPHDLSAKMLYKAASRAKRAYNNGITLCDLCDNKADQGFTCAKCERALES